MRYIGGKKNILPEIKKLLDSKIDGTETSFLDLFAGTNIVGAYFKRWYQVFSNDILMFSHLHAKAIIENNHIPAFEKLKKINIENPVQYLNNLQPTEQGYYSLAYSPVGGSMYFTEQNAGKIDSICLKINEWRGNNLIDDCEHAYLVACLINAIPFVSNITGTYGAYLKHWDKRALNTLALEPFTTIDNQKQNKAYNIDANKLVEQLQADIIYIDTPYNNRQYASNYHVLENIARDKKPELKGVTRIFPWSELKSDYATRNKASIAMKDLLSKLKCKHIIISYNNEGIISEADLEDMIRQHSLDGNVEKIVIPYRKYQSKIPSKDKNIYEILYYAKGKNFKSASNEDKPSAKIIKKPTVQVDKNQYIKSPLNYIGGKFKLLPQILPLFPKQINTFVDLFSGGANVGINTPAKKHIFNDMNHRINEMFELFASTDTLSLIESIEKRIQEYSLSKTNGQAFLAFREVYNANPNPLDLYILSSFSYNYQFRFNNNMQYNNPFGRDRSSFSDNMKKNLIAFSTKLQELDATFTSKLFNELELDSVGEGDMVYLDPPYLLTTGSYNDGNRGFLNWSETQEIAMYDLMRDLDKKGVYVALSNVIEHKGKQHKLLLDFLSNEKKFKHTLLNYSYANSSHNTKKAPSLEVLVTNYL